MVLPLPKAVGTTWNIFNFLWRSVVAHRLERLARALHNSEVTWLRKCTLTPRIQLCTYVSSKWVEANFRSKYHLLCQTTGHKDRRLNLLKCIQHRLLSHVVISVWYFRDPFHLTRSCLQLLKNTDNIGYRKW